MNRPTDVRRSLGTSWLLTPALLAGALSFSTISVAAPAAPRDFPIASYGFDDLNGTCQPRGWLAEDRTGLVFAHVSDRWLVNQPFFAGVGSGGSVGPDLASPLPDAAELAATNLGSILVMDASTSTLLEVFPALDSVGVYANLPTSFAGNYQVGFDPASGDAVTTHFGSGGATIFRIPRATQLPEVAAGGGLGTGDTLGLHARLEAVIDIAVDADGNIYFSETSQNRVRMLRKNDGRVVGVWGDGSASSGADGADARTSGCNAPTGLAVDGTTLYVCESATGRIRTVDLVAGTLGSLPGFPFPGFNGDFRQIAVSGGTVHFSDIGIVFRPIIYRFEAGTATPVVGAASVPDFGSAAAGAAGTNYPFAANALGGMSADGAGGLYFSDRDRELVLRLRTDLSLEAVAGSVVDVSMGERALWFGADESSAPDEVANWVHPEGYGGGWSQRLTSPPVSIADHPLAVLTFDVRIELDRRDLGTGISANAPSGHLIGVQAVFAGDVDTFSLLEAKAITPAFTPQGSFFTGTGIARYMVDFSSQGNLNDVTPIRIIVQTPTRQSNEDGLQEPGQGAAIIDNIRLVEAGVDLLPPATFEDGTTGVWTLSALNGAYDAPFGFPFLRNVPPPQTNVELRKNFDFSNASCVWTFTSPGDEVAIGTFARLTSPWVPMTPSQDTVLVALSGKLSLADQGRPVSVQFRFKDVGQSRPKISYHDAFLSSSGTDSDLNSPYLENFVVTFTPPTGSAHRLQSEPTGDSVQVVLQVEDRFEENGIEGRGPTRLPYLDNLAILQPGVDPDGDGVADPFDACPAVSAAGQDADGDGCIDPTATLRHVENWGNDRRPIRYAIRMGGSPLIGDGSDLTAIRAAVDAWTAAPGADVPVEEAPLSPKSNAEVLDGLNLITWEDDLVFPPDVLAVTPTTSFTVRSFFDDEPALPGEIVDSDLIFNPTVLFRTATTGPIPNSVDLESVAAHEIGHLLGLSHSGVPAATMAPVLQPGDEAASLAEDDHAAIGAAYPGAGFAAFGTITGTIFRGQDAQPIPGALVTALPVSGGVMDLAVASDYSDESGRYALRGLTAGDYTVQIAPLDGSIPGLVPEAVGTRVQEIAQTNFRAEYWSDPETDRDDPSLFAAFAVGSGATIPDINLVTTVDTIPPAITSVLPATGADSVGIDGTVLVNFSEPIDAATLQDAFALRQAGTLGRLGGTGKLIGGGVTFIFTPSDPLAFGLGYEIELSTALTDREGVPLASTFLSQFTTFELPAVAITDVNPRQPPRGAFITISGAGFVPGATNTRVRFTTTGGETTLVANATTNSAVIRVPSNAITGPIHVIVTPSLDTSNPFNLTVTQPVVELPAATGGPVSLLFAPSDVAVAPDGSNVFAVGSQSFATINLSPTRPSFRQAVPLDLRGGSKLVLSPDGLRAYVTRPDSGDVVEVDVDSSSAGFGQQYRVISTGGRPDGITFTADGFQAFVTDAAGGRVFRLDASPFSATYRSVVGEYTLPFASLTGGIAVDPGMPPQVSQFFATSSNQGLIQVGVQSDSLYFPIIAAPTEASAVLTVDAGQVFTVEPLPFGTRLRGTCIRGFCGPPVILNLGGTIRDLAAAPRGGSLVTINSALNSIQVVSLIGGIGLAGEVSTGQSPVAGAFSGDGSMLAVANFGDWTIGLYGMTDAGSEVLMWVNPPLAFPGEVAAARGTNDVWGTETIVEIAGTTRPVGNAPDGSSVSFATPQVTQQTTTVALESFGTRTGNLPFGIVDPVSEFAPAFSGIRVGLESVPCAPAVVGFTRVLRVSPDGRMLAVGREAAGCFTGFDLYRLSADGTNVFGELIRDNIAPIAASGPLLDLQFTNDSKQLWISVADVEGMTRVDVDPSSPTFGTGPGGIGGGAFPVLVRDPLQARVYTLFSNSTSEVLIWLDSGSMIDNEFFPGRFECAAMSPDGAYLVLGGPGHAIIVDPFLQVQGTTPTHDGAVVQVAVTADARRAVGIFADGNLAVWDLTLNSFGTELYFGPGLPAGTEFTDAVPGANTHSVIVGAANRNELYRIDVSVASPVVTTAPIGQPAVALDRAPGGRQLWIAEGGATSLSNIRLFALSDANQMALLSGDQQQTLGGTALPQLVKILVTDAVGRPEAGVVVEFALPDTTSGILDGFAMPRLRRITGADGQASVSWTMPPAPGIYDMTITALGTGLDPIAVSGESIEDASVAAPALVGLGPQDGAVGLNAGTEVFAFFSQRMEATSVTAHIALTANGNSVPGTFRLENDGRRVFFQPALPLPFSAACVLTVSAGALDREGQVLSTGGTSNFTVQEEPALAVTALSPPAGPPGASVTLNGQGFSAVPAQNVVRFAGVPAAVIAATTTSVVAVVPATAVSGGATVQVGITLSNALPFTVLPAVAESSAVVDTIPSSPGSFAIAVTPDGERAYVANSTSNTVGALDIQAATILATIPVGVEPRAIAILPDGSRGYVANFGSDDVTVIGTDPDSDGYNEKITTISVGPDPLAIAVSPVGPKVVVVNQGDGTLSIIDAQQDNATFDEVVENVNLGSGGTGIVISPDGARAFVTTGTGVSIVDLSSFVVENVNLGSGGTGIVISPDGGLLYVLTEDGQLVVLSVAPGGSAQVVENVNLGSGGTGIVISPDGTRLYVSLGDADEVLVFEITTSSQGGDQVTKLPGAAVTLTLVARIPVGDAPAGMDADPLGRFVVVANQGSGEISVLGKPESVAPPEPVVVEFKLYPNHLRIRDRYFWRWVRGSIEPPAPYTANQIVISSIRLNDVVPVDTTWFRWFQDWDFDGRQELSVAFRRAALALTLPNADTTVAVTVTGVVDDTPFVGVDSLRVKPKRIHRPHHHDDLTPGQLFTIEYDPESSAIQWVAVLHSLNGGETWETDLIHLPNTGAIAWTVPNSVTDSAMVAVVEVEDDSDPEGTVIGVLGMSDVFQIRGPLAVTPPPAELALSPVMPNPATDRVLVRFGLPRKSDVSLEVFDVAGRRVRTLVREVREPGWHDVSWDGRGAGGSTAGPGLYFVRLQAEGRTFHQRVVRLN